MTDSFPRARPHRPGIRCCWLLALALAGFIWPVAATAQVTSDPSDEDRFTVFLVTAGPGDAIWERFGHNGIWIHDAWMDEDLFWEWGLFSFTQSGFIMRLARGTMLYSMGGRPLSGVFNSYKAADRPMWAQELALTPDQEEALDHFVRVNAQPENRDYTYHYYLDNCSTRARDALDAVLGGVIRETFGAVPSGRTWRWHTQRLLRGVAWAEAGIQFVLGLPGDAATSEYEEMFLPIRLQEHLRSLTVRGSDGVERPFVVREVQLLQSSRPPEPGEPRGRLLFAITLGTMIALTFLLLGRWAGGAGGAGPRVLGLAAIFWWSVWGLAGVLLIVAWAFTDHDFWRWNENLFVANPLLLAAAWYALPLLVGRPPSARLARVASAVALLGLIGLLLGALPGLDQKNGDFLALLLLPSFALAWVLRGLGKDTGVT